MDGSKSYTICGDPLYFAPEIINHQGYDYAADLWAFGVLCFELFENFLPFGTMDTEETLIYKTVSSYEKNKILNMFQSKEACEKTKKFVNNLLQPVASKRIGYIDSNEILEDSFFSGFFTFFNKKKLSFFFMTFVIIILIIYLLLFSFIVYLFIFFF
jgi:serine/threonine protein kinase